MKKIITLFILLAVFTVSCGKKVKVDESQCLNPDELNQMLGEYYSSAGGPSGNTDSFDVNYDRFLKIHATIGCEINAGNVKEKFEAFEESRKEEKQNLTINDKAIYPLLILKNYKLLLTYKSVYATADHREEYDQMVKELENMKPDQFEKETVKTYNEITKLISKETMQDLKGYLIYPYSNVAHILQGDVKWTY